MLTVVEPIDLPKIGIKPILVGALPAIAINPKFKQGSVMRPQPPRAIAAHQFGNQVLQNPAMGHDPDAIAILMLL